MSHSDYENEQLAEATTFLKENWKTIVLVCAIGLGSIYGWRYWQSYQQQQLGKASDTYEQLVAKLSPENAQAATELETFTQNTSNVYAVLGALELAKFYVEQADYVKAQQQLALAAKKNKDDALKSVINLRFARVQFQQKQYDEALTTLDAISDPAWQVATKILRADIFVAKEDYNTALDIYSLAAATSPTAEQAQEIDMKLNQVRYLKSLHQAELAKIAKEAEKTSPVAENEKTAESTAPSADKSSEPAAPVADTKAESKADTAQ